MATKTRPAPKARVTYSAASRRGRPPKSPPVLRGPRWLVPVIMVGPYISIAVITLTLSVLALLIYRETLYAGLGRDACGREYAALWLIESEEYITPELDHDFIRRCIRARALFLT